MNGLVVFAPLIPLRATEIRITSNELDPFPARLNTNVDYNDFVLYACYTPGVNHETTTQDFSLTAYMRGLSLLSYNKHYFRNNLIIFKLVKPVIN